MEKVLNCVWDLFFFLRKQMVSCLDLFLYGSSEVLHCLWLLATDLELFNEVRFLRFGMPVTRKSLVKAAAKCFFFVKGQFALAMFTAVFLSCVSAAGLLYCKAFNEWRPYVSCIYVLIGYSLQCFYAKFVSHPLLTWHWQSLCKPDLLPFQNHMRVKIEEVDSEQIQNSSSKFEINLSEV